MQIPNVETLQSMTTAELEAVNQKIKAHILELRDAQIAINKIVRDRMIIDEVKSKHGVDVQIIAPKGIPSEEVVGTPGV